MLPYGITLPENYDPAKPTRLYVWLHGRNNTESSDQYPAHFLADGIANGTLPPICAWRLITAKLSIIRAL